MVKRDMCLRTTLPRAETINSGVCTCPWIAFRLLLSDPKRGGEWGGGWFRQDSATHPPTAPPNQPPPTLPPWSGLAKRVVKWCSKLANRVVRCPLRVNVLFLLGSDLGKLAKPSWQAVLKRVLGIRNQCYNCPTAPCGSRHDTQGGRAESETRGCSGNCQARRHPKVLLEHIKNWRLRRTSGLHCIQ